MNKWWKNPVLQGPENDYGDYDYLIEELPSNSVEWSFSKHASKCDSCGKESHLLLKSTSYFYTLDGYDYIGYDECWKCRLKEKVWSIKNKIKREVKIIKDAWNLSKQGNFKYWYKTLKEVRK